MVAQHYRWDFVGLSTDEKPTSETSEKVVDGSTFYCSDTSKLYVFCKDTWYERKALGGGGGGTTYTAGDGIDITDDTISVDTDTIQEKLTAGTGIDITNNTISATGGGGVTPVQTTGTSTTDVMSQDATTKMIFPDITNSGSGKILIGSNSSIAGSRGIAINSTQQNAASTDCIGISTDPTSPTYLGANGKVGGSIAIGSGSGIAWGNESTVIGFGASVMGSINAAHNTAIGARTFIDGKNYCVALGYGAKPTRDGEVNVGAGTSGNGYNNTNYRVIGGVHDGQLANDAVTVGQINALIDAINSATNSSIPHIGS